MRGPSDSGGPGPGPVEGRLDPSTGLRCAFSQGYRFLWKDDGRDYPGLLARYWGGELAAIPLSVGRPFRQVFRVEDQGRRYVIKHDTYVETRWEKKLMARLMGTRYSRLLTFTARAGKAGCAGIQDVYLVAEKMAGRQCREAYLVSEYLEGRHLSPEELERKLPELRELMIRIHRCGLASNDFQPNNFLLSPQGPLAAIDLDVSSPLLVCQVNDALAMRRRYGLNLPLAGWSRALWTLLRFRDYLINRSRQVRGKPLRPY